MRLHESESAAAHAFTVTAHPRASSVAVAANPVADDGTRKPGGQVHTISLQVGIRPAGGRTTRLSGFVVSAVKLLSNVDAFDAREHVYPWLCGTDIEACRYGRDVKPLCSSKDVMTLPVYPSIADDDCGIWRFVRKDARAGRYYSTDRRGIRCFYRRYLRCWRHPAGERRHVWSLACRNLRSCPGLGRE